MRIESRVIVLLILFANLPSASGATLIATLAQTAPFDHPYLAATVGYIFKTPSVSVKVTELGFWDYLENGFTYGVDVGLWSEDATLIASTSLAAGTQHPLVQGFRYNALAAPVILQPNTLYVLGGFRHIGDAYSPNLREGIDFVPAPGFDIIGERYPHPIPQYPDGDRSLTFPSFTYDPLNSEAAIGPNLVFEPVPEPSMGALATVASSAILLIARHGSRSWVRG